MSTAVTVLVGDERYALSVEHVEEISELGSVAVLPGAGRAVVGVRNLRGRILPVFDLRRVLGVEGEEPTKLVVATVGGVTAGLAVTEVDGVGALEDALQPTTSELLAGAALVGDALVGVLDAGRLFTTLARTAAS